jgi:hypothetical protein
MLQSVTLKHSDVKVQLTLQFGKFYTVRYTDKMMDCDNLGSLNDRSAAIAAELLNESGYCLRRNDLDNAGDRVTLPGWMSSEMENALLTAENHGAAYRLLGDDGESTNIQARCELAREIVKYHPDLSKADRQTVIAQVIAQWIADSNS